MCNEDKIKLGPNFVKKKPNPRVFKICSVFGKGTIIALWRIIFESMAR
jgi:hypothetical protein